MFKRLHISALLLILLFSALISPACESNRGQIIPYEPVYFNLDIYAQLGDMGNNTTRVIPNEGHQGIVLYRESFQSFFAYDMTCTQYPLHDESVVADTTFDGVYICPKCKSSFLILNGAYPNSGPAQYPLQEYKTSIQGNLLIISN